MTGGLTGIAVDTLGNIYVTQDLTGVSPSVSSVFEYAAGSNGDVTPMATITGSSTGLADAQAVAVDKVGNIYVANIAGGTGTPSITEYAVGGNGNVAPTATIKGSNTGLFPVGVAVDSKGTIYVLNQADAAAGTPSSITEYPIGSNGNVTPSATITGSNTMLAGRPLGIALDSSANIFVTNGPVLEFTAGSNGNVAPSSTITGGNTHLAGIPVGIAVELTSGAIAVVNSASTVDGFQPEIPIFASGSSGNATPSQLLTTASLELSRPGGVAVDISGNIYAAIGSGAGGGGIVVYPAGSAGNAAPIAVIEGSNTTINNPGQIAVDSTTIYVANCNSNNLLEFPLTANGNVAPSAVISGSNTGLGCPTGVALDSSGNIYAANDINPGTVTEYAKGASGNATPIATISGSNTDLSFVESLAVDPSGKIYVISGGCSTCSPTISAALLVFAAGANGNATPIATISGSNTGVGQSFFLQYIAVDTGGNMYVDGQSDILIFKAGDNGDVPPDATLGGPLTQISSPQGIALAP